MVVVCHTLLYGVRSKLKVEDLKEKQLMIKDAAWAEDKEAAECRQCTKQFSVSRRRVCTETVIMIMIIDTCKVLPQS